MAKPTTTTALLANSFLPLPISWAGNSLLMPMEADTSYNKVEWAISLRVPYNQQPHHIKNQSEKIESQSFLLRGWLSKVSSEARRQKSILFKNVSKNALVAQSSLGHCCKLYTNWKLLCSKPLEATAIKVHLVLSIYQSVSRVFYCESCDNLSPFLRHVSESSSLRPQHSETFQCTKKVQKRTFRFASNQER